MKKLSIFLALALCAALIGGCASSGAATTAETAEESSAPETAAEEPVAESTEEDVVTIGYGAPELGGAQPAIMGSMVTAAQNRLWKVVSTNANYDASTQANQMDYFISLGVNAIVVIPQDSKAICSSIEKATAADIPVFTLDRAPIGCEVVMTVQSDNYQAGKVGAEELVKFLTERYGEPKGTVLELQGDLGSDVAQLRGNGFDDVIAQYPDITLIQKPTEWKTEKFSQATLDVASAQEIDGIYMHSDSAGYSPVKQALESIGKLYKRGEDGHIWIGGVDGAPDNMEAIREGYQDQSSSQPFLDFGELVAQYWEKMQAGEEITAGEVTKEGALWSPATLEKTDTGWLLTLSVANVTIDNVDDPSLWGNE